jgi:hypothetical protein
MQILYAAPFLLIAAICCFVCAVIQSARRSALVLPAGVLAFGVGSLISYVIFAFVMYKCGYKGPANWTYLLPYILGGLAISICASLIWRNIVASLPQSLIKIGLTTATFSSLLVLLPCCSWGVAHFIKLDRAHLGWMAIPGVLYVAVASFVSWRLFRVSNQFQPTLWRPAMFSNNRETENSISRVTDSKNEPPGPLP